MKICDNTHAEIVYNGRRNRIAGERIIKQAHKIKCSICKNADGKIYTSTLNGFLVGPVISKVSYCPKCLLLYDFDIAKHKILKPRLEWQKEITLVETFDDFFNLACNRKHNWSFIYSRVSEATQAAAFGMTGESINEYSRDNCLAYFLIKKPAIIDNFVFKYINKDNGSLHLSKGDLHFLTIGKERFIYQMKDVRPYHSNGRAVHIWLTKIKEKE